MLYGLVSLTAGTESENFCCHGSCNARRVSRLRDTQIPELHTIELTMLCFRSLCKRLLGQQHVIRSFPNPIGVSWGTVHRFKSTDRFCLSVEKKKEYETEGFLIIEDVFDKEHVQKMKDAMDECEERAKTMRESSKHYSLDPQHTLASPMLQRVHIPSLLFPIYEQTIGDEKLLDFVEDLIGPNIRYIRQDKVNLKLPKGTGFPIKWHQDWAFNPHTNQNILMACVSIDDTTRENGCLQVVPRSHKGPLFSHFKNGEFVSAINDERFDASRAVHVEVPSGGVSLHHVQTIHGSAANISDRKRRLFVYQYCSTDAWPLLGVSSLEETNIGPLDWDRFKSTLLRGEITLFPKMEAIPLSLPVPFDKGYVFEHQDTIKSSHDNPR